MNRGEAVAGPRSLPTWADALLDAAVPIPDPWPCEASVPEDDADLELELVPPGWPENDPIYLQLIGALPPADETSAGADDSGRTRAEPRVEGSRPSAQLAAARPVLDAPYEELDALTAELVAIEWERSALEARRASVLARGYSWAARWADEVVALSETPAHRRELAHRLMLAEFATATRTSERTLAAHVDRAAALVAHPSVHSALSAGTISAVHAAVIVDELEALLHAEGEPPAADAVAEFERRLLDRACVSAPGEVGRLARRWREKVLPEALTVRHQRARAGRRVWLEALDDGMGCLHAVAPIDELSRIRASLTSEAIDLHKADDSRTIDQLRADVLVQRLLADGVSGRPAGGPDAFDDDATLKVLPSLRVLVTVPVMTLAGLSEEPGQLDGYGPIPPDMARRLVAHAPSLTRVLTHPVTGTVLDVDRTSYKVPKSLRNWLMARDGWCRFPGCSRRAIACDTDHTIPWEHGGTTSADNLAHLCRKHHRLKGLTDWRVAQVKPARGQDGSSANGTLSWVRPTGRSYVTRPVEGSG